MESSPFPPLILVAPAVEATKAIESFPAPPPRKPLFTLVAPENLTESLPLPPFKRNSLAEVAETPTKIVSWPSPPLNAPPLN